MATSTRLTGYSLEHPIIEYQNRYSVTRKTFFYENNDKIFRTINKPILSTLFFTVSKFYKNLVKWGLPEMECSVAETTNLDREWCTLCLYCYYFHIVLFLYLYGRYVVYPDHHFTVIYLLQTCVLRVCLVITSTLFYLYTCTVAMLCNLIKIRSLFAPHNKPRSK